MHANRSRREVETPAPEMEDQYFIALVVPNDPLTEGAREPELPAGTDRMALGGGAGASSAVIFFLPHDPP